MQAAYFPYDPVPRPQLNVPGMRTCLKLGQSVSLLWKFDRVDLGPKLPFAGGRHASAHGNG